MPCVIVPGTSQWPRLFGEHTNSLQSRANTIGNVTHDSLQAKLSLSLVYDFIDFSKSHRDFALVSSY